MVQRGLIPHLRIGRNVRIREKDLIRWIEEQTLKDVTLSDVWFLPRV